MWVRIASGTEGTLVEWKRRIDHRIVKLESSIACSLFDTRCAGEIPASVRTLPEQGSQAENCSKQSGFLAAWGFLGGLCAGFFFVFFFNNQGV